MPRSVWLRRDHEQDGATNDQTVFIGLSFPVQDLAGRDQARGEILVRSCGGHASIRLGETAAREGVLLGRVEPGLILTLANKAAVSWLPFH